ncbi:MAG: ATP synthase subunit I [Candidatus Hydrogenedentota bacterium]
MTTTIATYIGLVLAGFLLGLVFYGGLRLTVDYILKVHYPGLLLFLSAVVRTFLVLAGLLLVTGGRWYFIVAALAGFLVARFVLLWYWGGLPKQKEVL